MWFSLSWIVLIFLESSLIGRVGEIFPISNNRKVMTEVTQIHLAQGKDTRQERAQRRIEHLNEALRKDPKDVDAYLERGRLRFVFLQDLKGALADANQALKHNSLSSSAYYLRGFVRRNMGDYKGSLADLKRARILELWKNLEEANQTLQRNPRSIQTLLTRSSIAFLMPVRYDFRIKFSI
jgi:tetratricopeptide (TPR) repeat protein